MSEVSRHVAIVDKRPYFEKALCFGVQRGLIAAEIWQTMIVDGAKGSVQVADHFGGSHLQADLESARKRIVHLVSLYLEESFGDDLAKAAESLRDNTFLSHSRGGNEMLKNLHAMPESSIFGGVNGQPLKEFQDECTLAKPMSLAAYRKELLRRGDNISALAAARWFAQSMGLPIAEIDSCFADSVIRTAILMRLVGQNTCPTRNLFAQLVDGLRTALQASGKLKFSRNFLDDVPPEYGDIAKSIRREIEKHDAPMLLNASLALEVVLNDLESAYFLRESGLEDVGDHDSFVSKEWHALTKGKEDPYSRLTLFLCLAADVTPKTSLTETEAKALIRKVQASGFDERVVPELIEAAAPFELKQGLLTLWEEEFFPDAQTYLLDDAHPIGSVGMRFLKDNCNITQKSMAKKKA